MSEKVKNLGIRTTLQDWEDLKMLAMKRRTGVQALIEAVIPGILSGVAVPAASSAAHIPAEIAELADILKEDTTEGRALKGAVLVALNEYREAKQRTAASAKAEPKPREAARHGRKTGAA